MVQAEIAEREFEKKLEKEIEQRSTGYLRELKNIELEEKKLFERAVREEYMNRIGEGEQ